MKLLKSIGLPPHFDDTNEYAIDVEDNPQTISETSVFTTDLDYVTAKTALTAFLTAQFAAPALTDVGISAIMTFATTYQRGTAQITDLGESCGGYITLTSQWAWPNAQPEAQPKVGP